MGSSFAGCARRFTGFGGDVDFPDPFADVATSAMPDQFADVLQWGEYIYSTFGTYRMAMERVIAYFLTDLEISGGSDEEKEKYHRFLTKRLDVLTFLQDVLRDRMAYGNAFASVLVPFKRFLRCPKTGSMYVLEEVYRNPVFQFAWDRQKFEFVATCPESGWRGSWEVVDVPQDEEQKIRLKRWSPHEIQMVHCPWTNEVAYYWKIPEDYKRLVREGHLYHLERVPDQVLIAIRDNLQYRFKSDALFHMKEPTLGGHRNRGWGLPRVLANFRQIWYVQVLRRYNEAIALDYVIPFRLVTPMPRPGGGGEISGFSMNDPIMGENGAQFRGDVQRMLARRRRDPASWQVLPFPVQYQMLGGDANQLATPDLLNQGIETLLNDIGTPVELYRGSLQLQTAPVALRLYEATWRHMVHDCNLFLTWVGEQLSRIMAWEAVEIALQRVTLADDIEKQMAALQLMAAQQLSGHTGLGMLGFNWDLEQQRIADEARKQQEIQARNQEEMAEAGFASQIIKGQGDPAQQGAAPGGAAPAGGAPAGGAPAGPVDPVTGAPMQMPVSSYIQGMGPDTPVTPNDMDASAQQLADELLGLPEGIKDSQLRQLKTYNQWLHALVKEKMDTGRRQRRQQAEMMVAGGGAAAA